MQHHWVAEKEHKLLRCVEGLCLTVPKNRRLGFLQHPRARPIILQQDAVQKLLTKQPSLTLGMALRYWRPRQGFVNGY